MINYPLLQGQENVKTEGDTLYFVLEGPLEGTPIVETNGEYYAYKPFSDSGSHVDLYGKFITYVTDEPYDVPHFEETKGIIRIGEYLYSTGENRSLDAYINFGLKEDGSFVTGADSIRYNTDYLTLGYYGDRFYDGGFVTQWGTIVNEMTPYSISLSVPDTEVDVIYRIKMRDE